jgi:hypothetical protein
LRPRGSALCVAGLTLAACVASGEGTPPPGQLFYYPTGLIVSAGGNVLYAVNSDFDLQYSGGTVQSYDLTGIRNDAVRLILGDYAGAPDAGPLPAPVDSGAVDSGVPSEDSGQEDAGVDAAPADGATGDAADGDTGDAGDAGDASTGLGDDAGDAPTGADDAAALPDSSTLDAGSPLEPDASPLVCAPVDAGPLDAALPFYSGSPNLAAACPQTNESPNNPGGITDPNDPNAFNGMNGRLPLGEACAPAMSSQAYWRDSVTIGAFATDMQLSKNKDRIFIPVRGDATLTWFDVTYDGDCYRAPTPNDTAATYAPFRLQCIGGGTAPGRSCPDNHAGALSDINNTRQLAMPGEPFGMAFSDDGTSIVLTHQAEGATSLYLSGLVPGNTVPNSPTNFNPSIQYVLTNGPNGATGVAVPTGGIGVVAVPHDPAAIPTDPSNPVPTYIRPSFLETFDSAQEVDLLGYYPDEGYQGLLPATDAGPVVTSSGGFVVGSTNLRPFLLREQIFPLTVNASGVNSRGIAIDPTPRIACEMSLPPGTPTTDPAYIACAQTPARVFIANRSPASLILGTVGGMSGEGTTYDPDLLSIYGNIPLQNGPSNVYIAPIVDRTGHYAVRVFVVCFDSQSLIVYDPDAQVVENVISTGTAPFAMAFDPFDMTQVAIHAAVPFDQRARTRIIDRSNPALDGKPALRTYRFAYLADFTDSFVQVLDLDSSFEDDRLPQGDSTYENFVYTLGLPTLPVGQN